ncbi:MAG: hypothetical protein K0R52_1493 [Alphaproteobacteria bacterium]|nr:hypothetical protein [Alphaproteobacteria bacterium]
MNTMTILTDADLEKICGGGGGDPLPESNAILNTASGNLMPPQTSVDGSKLWELIKEGDAPFVGTYVPPVV